MNITTAIKKHFKATIAKSAFKTSLIIMNNHTIDIVERASITGIIIIIYLSLDKLLL